MSGEVEPRRAVATMIAVFLISLPLVTTRIYASDEIQYFAYLRSLWFDHDVSFDNEYLYFYRSGTSATPGFQETHLDRTTETGKRINFGTIGSALLWAPFYAASDVYVALARATGRDTARDGYSAPYVRAVSYASAFYGFLALVMSSFAARRVTGAGLGTTSLAAACVWIGTPLFFYMYLAPVFAHATSAFAVALFVTTWLLVRQTWSFSGVAALGASGALMVMVREQDASYAIGPAIDFLWQHAGAGAATVRRSLVSVVGAAAAFAVVYAPQALAYVSLNGRIGPSQLVMRKLYWWSPHAWEVLFSPRHGFFVWTPLAILAIAGLIVVAVHLWRAELPSAVNQTRPLAISLVAMVIGQIYLLGALDSWTSAGAFGQRRFIGATILLVIGLAGLFRWLGGRSTSRAAAAFVVLSIYWNLALMAEFGTGLMDRQRLELGRNVYDAFVTLPRRGPELAWRYLTQRESFYRNAPGEGH